MKSLLPILIFLLSTIPCFAKSELNKSADYYNELGIKYGEQGDFDNAVEYFQKAIQINPKYTSAYVNLGIIYGKMGEYDNAIENLNKALELNSHLQEIYINLGVIYEKTGDYDKAIKYAQEALSLGRKDPIANYNLGYVYIKRKDRTRAARQYDILREIGEDNLADKLQREVIQADREMNKKQLIVVR